MENADPRTLSTEAKEVVEMIYELSTGIMFSQYENLSTGAKMRIAEVTRNTKKMLEDDMT